jgi:hypothetical protein
VTGFADLTDGEVAELQFRAYSWAMRLYRSADDLRGRASALPSRLTPEWDGLMSRASAAMSAAREQDGLYYELRDALRGRSDARKENAGA